MSLQKLKGVFMSSKQQWIMISSLPFQFLGFAASSMAADVPVFQGEVSRVFETFDARQAVAVDENHFYAISNFRLTKHDKDSGEPLLQWDGVSEDTGPLVHMDSGLVMDGKLYATHSNYPAWPMRSSIEIWDADTLEHINSHSFGIQFGSMTWLDYHEGFWWAGFGNYDKVQGGQSHAYGLTENTKVIRLDENFRPLEQWGLPADLRARMTPMSNSGGSWGPDGRLYLTGHDHPEVYVMELPRSGGDLEWVATISVEGLNGQGVAWDRSESAADANQLWGILKSDRLVYRIDMPELPGTLSKGVEGVVRLPGEFAR